MAFFDFLNPAKQFKSVFGGGGDSGGGSFNPMDPTGMMGSMFGGGSGNPLTNIFGGGQAGPSQPSGTGGNYATGGAALEANGSLPGTGGGAGTAVGDSGGLGGMFGGLFGGGGGGGSPMNMIGNMLGLTPQPTQPRSLYGEGRNTLYAESQLAPDVYGLESTYRPNYAGLERDIYRDSIYSDIGLSGIQRMSTSSDPDNAALLDEANRQALEELQLGATLDPSLRAEVQGGVRAGQASRGMGYGPSDVYEEAMQIGSAGQNLRNQRRAYASNVAGQNMANRSQLLPFAAQGTAYAQGGKPQMFNPWNPYGMDLYNTNFNADVARKVAASENLAALYGGVAKAAGSILG
jgi:hypothetical protein